MKTFDIVVAACNNRGIGANGKLPWRLKGDMAFFKRLTTETQKPGKQNAVIMGRKTWDSIPEKFRPLRDRKNIVVSRSMENDKDIVTVVKSFSEALQAVTKEEQYIDNVFVIGGSSIYQEALLSDSCSKLYLTRVFADIDCDVFLPSFNEEKFKKILEAGIDDVVHEENDLKYQIEVFEKVGISAPLTKVMVAVLEKSRGIAFQNELPWPTIKEDYIYFSTKVAQVHSEGATNSIIIGWRTFEQMIQSDYSRLSHLKNIVITKHHRPEAEKNQYVAGVVDSFQAALDMSHDLGVETAWVLGGQQVYEDSVLVAACEELWITKVCQEFPADRFFPPYEHLYKMVSCSEMKTSEHNVPFQFCVFKRKTISSAFEEESS